VGNLNSGSWDYYQPYPDGETESWSFSNCSVVVEEFWFEEQVKRCLGKEIGRES
jgi:hypothetical protein